MKKAVYEVNKKGTITKYNINYDIERFTFIPRETNVLDKVVNALNKLLSDFAGVRPYTLDWDEIIAQYKERNMQDVPHFSSQYVVAQYLFKKGGGPMEEKQMMYLEIVNRLNELIEKGELHA